MKPSIAVIDIGSNSVRLMLAETEQGRVRALSKELISTRLARGIDRTHALSEDRMADTVKAIGAFRKKADAFGIPVIAYATSAVRDADNREAFVSRVRNETGVRVRVLSGEQEGAFAFRAATGGKGSVFDIGGGSFQIVTGDRALSFPCGCVRAKEHCDASDKDTLIETLFLWMDERSEVPGSVPAPVYGVGGTITSIGALLAKQVRYDPTRLETITLLNLDELLSRLCAIAEPVRMQHPLLLSRGDVILHGAAILRYMMVRTHTDAVIPVDRDGMEGIAEAFLNGELTD
jgi:exopolyphosphatase/guanosine-5'-triphosphate,3'-diphosphate pyrophosphatase